MIDSSLDADLGRATARGKVKHHVNCRCSWRQYVLKEREGSLQREYWLVCLSVEPRILIGWCRPITRPSLWQWVEQWEEIRLLSFLGILRGAIRDGFPKVSSENLILLVKSHHHTRNQEWRREAESMRELTKRSKTNSQSINQPQATVFACLYCAYFQFRVFTLDSWCGGEVLTRNFGKFFANGTAQHPSKPQHRALAPHIATNQAEWLVCITQWHSGFWSTNKPIKNYASRTLPAPSTGTAARCINIT